MIQNQTNQVAMRLIRQMARGRNEAEVEKEIVGEVSVKEVHGDEGVHVVERESGLTKEVIKLR